jgi:hypothetical protein
MKKTMLAVILMMPVLLAGGTGMEAGKPSARENKRNLFYIQEGENRNFFLQDRGLNVHVLLSSGRKNRLLFCFPRGNSGVAFIFEPPRDEKLSLEFCGSPEARPGKESTGVAVKVRSGGNKVRISAVYMDSIRLIRRLDNPEALKEALGDKEEFAVNRGLPLRGAVEPAVEIIRTGGETGLLFDCTSLDGKHRYEAEVRLPEGCRASLEGPVATLQADGGARLQFEVRAGVEWPELTALPIEKIVTRETLDFPSRLSGSAEVSSFRQALRSLGFLAFREKMLAGSWQYLTYFGRDTLISIMLLQRCLRPSVYEDALESVLSRTSDAGDVAHEEDIGGQAILRRVRIYNGEIREGREEQARKILNELSESIYDYKMVDDDFILPVAAWRYCGEGAVLPEKQRVFWERKNSRGEANLVTLLRNFEFCLGKALVFARRPLPENLVRIGSSGVGDWRDSRNGLGGGVYPSSVNLYLVPTALASIEKFLKSSGFSSGELARIAEKKGFKEVAAALVDDSIIAAASEEWRKAGKFFRVKLDREDLRARLSAYFNGFDIPPGEKRTLLSLPLEGGVTVGDFLYGRAVPGLLRDGLEFPALSLDGGGSPVPVENSDFGFKLLMGEPSAEEVRTFLEILRLPYPLGLRSEAGIFVANPLLSGRPALWKALDRNAYHGTVVWSWQDAMIRLGLIRQYRKYSKLPEYGALADEIRECFKLLHRSCGNAAGLVHSELWTWRAEDAGLRPIPFGLEESAETESNPVQLWSTVYLALAMEEADLEGK